MDLLYFAWVREAVGTGRARSGDLPAGDGRMIRVVVSPAPIDVTAELARIEALEAGAVATFTGIVRADDGVSVLDLEHYPGATETALETLAAEALARWRLTGAILVTIGRAHV